jgi:hypothetical protein
MFRGGFEVNVEGFGNFKKRQFRPPLQKLQNLNAPMVRKTPYDFLKMPCLWHALYT